VQDGALRVFGWPALQPLLHVPAAHADAVRSLDFSADGRFLACTSRSRRCPVWELAPPARQEPLAVLETAQVRPEHSLDPG
jgi:WD40 repeat protein